MFKKFINLLFIFIIIISQSTVLLSENNEQTKIPVNTYDFKIPQNQLE